MSKLQIKHAHVMRKPGIQGGRPVITGTRIPVSTLALWHKQGKDVDAILELYPELRPAQVHDALSYYYDFQQEIEKEILLLQNEKHWQQRYPGGKGRSRE